MEIKKTKLHNVMIIQPRVFSDERGYFSETWNKERYIELGIKEDFVQDNLSYSKKHVLRGLHFQNPNSQGKLVYVLSGEVFDVAVDIRLNSPTYGEWVGVTLSSDNKRQFYIPPGFAHGFCVISESALFAYKCTDKYNQYAEHTIIWNDADLAIDWPIKNPIVSEKDQHGRHLSEFVATELPIYNLNDYKLTGT